MPAIITNLSHQHQQHFSKTILRKISKIVTHWLERKDGQRSKRRLTILIRLHKIINMSVHTARTRTQRDYQASRIIWPYSSRIMAQLMIQTMQRLMREVTSIIIRVVLITAITSPCRLQITTKTKYKITILDKCRTIKSMELDQQLQVEVKQVSHKLPQEEIYRKQPLIKIKPQLGQIRHRTRAKWTWVLDSHWAPKAQRLRTR